jgi:hypothetical protein
MNPLLWIFQFAFGCRHHHVSRVFTIKHRTYQVCLECGREFDYSWARMHSRRPSVANNAYATLDTVRKAEAPAV